jgi:S-adenosylmethionine synthetase
MSTTFMRSQKTFFTSESVTEGHPDKLCDQISDAVLDAVLAEDPHGRVACEVATTTGMVLVFGEITTTTRLDFQTIARRTIAEVGYTNAEYGFDATTAAVLVSVKEQSPEISKGVSTALEVRQGAEATLLSLIGAGDQGMVIGFACSETPELMPMPITLAHALTRQLAEARKSGDIAYLRPDGKSQVTVEYHCGKPVRVDAIVISSQHDPKVTQEQIASDVEAKVIRAVIPPALLDEDTRMLINPSGSFAMGGPMGDAGLTGRKIIVDTYGGMASHGGGAFSGKDPTKIDRSGAYAARYVAKNIVAAGLADRLEIQISYAIGVAHPVSIFVETFGTEHVDVDLILMLINQNFDLRPGAIIQDLDLLRPIYRKIATDGQFGRPGLPWERTDKVALLREQGGLASVELPTAR